MRLLKRHWLPVACVVAALVKLALCAGMPLDVHAGASYDDAWAVRAADFIAQGQWLGPYDDTALIKNPGFPAWLALCSLSGAGYLLPTALLYVVATALFAAAVRPLLQRDWAVFALFVLLLFCPVSFATDTYQRVYRNSVTAAQVLVVFASYIGFYLRVREGGGLPLAAVWMLPAAICLPWFWLTREDSVWIAPFVAVATLVLAASLFRNRRSAGLVRAAFALLFAVLPPVSTVAAVEAVQAENESRYGVAVSAEINSGNFARMVKDLYAIDPGADAPSNIRVAVSHGTLLRAYGASATLTGIRAEAEDQFYNWGDAVDSNPGDGEVNGGEFFWVLRRAARDAGIYDRGARQADAFYASIAEELEATFADGSLQRRQTMPSSIMTPWRAEYAHLLPSAFATIVSEALGYGDVTAMPFAAQGSADGIAYFERITGGSAFHEGDAIPVACLVGERIIGAYRVAGPLLALAGAVSTLLLFARWARTRRGGGLLLVLASLLGGALPLAIGLAYSLVSSFVPIAFYYYGSALYPLLLAFNGVALGGIISLRAQSGKAG